ncbi:MAG: formate dehydrogenase accessory sulfurtransferase FdhD [Actinomycetales bacterium]|nr:formate dehydrogenase accessory sulfurtransferase FdhD [Actinomycetales bacterium]
MTRVTRRRRIIRYAVGSPPAPREDVVAVEEPLQIRLSALAHGPAATPPRDLTVTMRTPGHDFDLVAGFLVGEAIVRAPDDIAMMRYCAGTNEAGEQTFNVIDVTLGAGIPLPGAETQRQVLTSSACGICGTTSIDQVRKTVPDSVGSELSLSTAAESAWRVSVGTLLELPDALRDGQGLFAKTGGVHAAGLFTAYGAVVCVREDVGRHNAVDKVVGWALREGRLPLRDTVLQVSGRASFELVQKAALAGIPVLAAVGAPSSLAVELADELGLTLIGFSRGRSLNVYTHTRRIEG